MENILFRSEEPFGDGVRDIVEVIKYETFSLGNTDILDYVSDHYEAFDADLSRKMRDISAEIAVCGGTILSEKEKTELIQDVVNSLNAYWGVSLKYCLWLAEKETVIEYYEASPESVEAYETSDYVLVDLGYDGMLFGYEEFPKSIEGYMECLSLLEQLVAFGCIEKDSENEGNILIYRESGTLSPEGWYSESIISVARELVDDKEGQEFLTKQLEKISTESIDIDNISSCSDAELKVLAQQALRLNEHGATGEQPLRHLIDADGTPTAVLSVSMKIFLECTKRWVNWRKEN